MKLKTMEEALETYPNRFQLTMMAVARAKEINEGEAPLVQPEEQSKPVVVALKEIADGLVVPANRDQMGKIREARRVLRERALLEAEEEDLLDGNEDDGSYASAHSGEDVVEN